jgi:tetratricopeptide (TPR) repeat protein
MYKPKLINQTLFWNSDFSYGIGLIPTFAATTGILGILSWIFFFAMFLWVGLRAIFYSLTDLFSRFLIMSTFMISLFLWIMTVFYVPSAVIIMLAFFFTGLFAATLRRNGLLKSHTFSLVNHPKLSFVSVIVLVALIIGNVALGYLVLEKASSSYYFQKGFTLVQSKQDLDQGEQAIARAISLGAYDTYYRGLAQIDMLRVNRILSKADATTETVKAPFQQGIGNAIENARQATLIDPQNPQNWLTLAQVYASLVPVPFSIPGAYENAKAAYEAGAKVTPNDPNIPFLLARNEVAHNDLAKARQYTNDAISLKNNFADAYFLLAQIEVTENNLYKAIPALQTTLILSPNNPGLYFQLGLMQYDQKDYPGAGDSFGKALAQVPDYANAKYFLGLTLAKLDRTADAITVFNDLQVSNPDNNDIKNILTNLNAGKDPFANVPPPKNQPEKAANPPLPQKN